MGKNDQKDKAKRGGNTNIIEMNEGFLYKLIFRKVNIFYYFYLIIFYYIFTFFRL